MDELLHLVVYIEKGAPTYLGCSKRSTHCLFQSSLGGMGELSPEKLTIPTHKTAAKFCALNFSPGQ